MTSRNIPPHILKRIDRVAHTYLNHLKIKKASMVSVGDIFVSSWGYDQTNVDFYQVVGTTKTMVVLRPLDKHVVRGKGQPTEYVMPLVNTFRGHAFRRKLTTGMRGDPWVGLTSYSAAKKWDGKEQPQTGASYGR